jgi:hypothetical protein
VLDWSPSCSSERRAIADSWTTATLVFPRNDRIVPPTDPSFWFCLYPLTKSVVGCELVPELGESV